MNTVDIILILCLFFSLIIIFLIYKLLHNKNNIIYKCWVATDKDGKTFCYKDKPYRGNFFWISKKSGCFEIFPVDKLSWDDEPAEMIIIRKPKIT